jgi:uncharacterized repeat protein (TIGR01451 family)
MKKWHYRLSLLLSALSIFGEAWGATPPGQSITNTATISYSIDNTAGGQNNTSNIVVTANNTVVTATSVAARIDLGVATAGSTAGVLNATQCVASGGAMALAAPSFSSQSNYTLPQGVNFTVENTFKSGDPLFIRVVDPGAIKNSSVIDTASVLVQTTSGDKESLNLSETGPGTGIFIGYIQLTRTVPVPGNCELSVNSNDKITVSYQNSNNTITSSANVLLDPLGKVFDTSSGALVDNASITLIDEATNQPAQVFGDDGVSVYPSTMITGTTVKDSKGNTYQYDHGQYRFPQVAAGNYKLVVKPPSGLFFPTTLSDQNLQKYSSTYHIVVGSKGEIFPVAVKTLDIDIPLDERQGKLVVNKTASKSEAAIGDFVQYTVTVQNADTHGVDNVVFQDILPRGLRVRTNSFKVNGTLFSPNITQGTHLQYNLGSLAASATDTITYVAEITVATPLGTSTNQAQAISPAVSSNVAQASIFVKDDLMMDKTIVVGTVFETQDCNRTTLKRLGDVRIQFETGDYAVSDKDGLWHIDNLQPGTHVAQIDKYDLPEGYEPVLCENTTAFAGKASSRFVEARSGGIARVDFYLRKTPEALKKEADKAHQDNNTNTNNTNSINSNSAQADIKIEPTAAMDNAASAVGVNTNNPVNSHSASIMTNHNTPDVKDTDVSLGKAGTEALSKNDEFMSHAKPEAQFLFPDEHFIPSVAAIGVAFQYDSLHSVKLFVNGTEVDKFSEDGIRQSADKKTSIAYWRGVPIREGRNMLEMHEYDQNKNQITVHHKEIIYSNTITQAVFVPDQSQMLADGKTPLVIAVRFFDEFGRPAHKGMFGAYDATGGYAPFIDRSDGQPIDMIGLTAQDRNQFIVGENGLAKIRFMPSSQSGEMVLKFKLKDNTAIVKPWITSAPRDWILVGIADGTLAHDIVSNHTEGDDKGMDIVEGDSGRIAFYGKGTIKEKYLITIAYDNKKQTNTDTPIGQTAIGINPEEVYPVYGDATIGQQDAASAKKLYIRIEREKFYAMFGDYQTNLTVTDLTRYQRQLTGLKSEYKGDKVNYNLFAARTATLLQSEEIPADGTTGLYHSKLQVEPYSETVSIVTRDRNQRDHILQTQSLTRFVDYDIDYDLGTIRLKAPVAPYDIYFNPNFIRIEYSSDDPRGEHTIVGGRMGYKVTEKIEVGVTSVNESSPVEKANMSGVDATYDDGTHLKVKAEAALSHDNDSVEPKQGSAYSLDAQYQNTWGQAHAYAKRVDTGFGMDNALPNDLGLAEIGTDLDYKLSETLKLKAQAIYEKELDDGRSQITTDIKLEKKFSEQFTLYGGIKEIHTNNTGNVSTTDSNSTSNNLLTTTDLIPIGGGSAYNAQTPSGNDTLFLLGGQYRLSSIPLSLMGQVEFNPKPSDNAPSRYRIGAEYDITTRYTLVADEEYDQYASTTLNTDRIGIKAKPWNGGRIQSYVGSATDAGDNAFYQVAFDQSVIAKSWTFDAGVGRQAWTKHIDETQVPVGAIMTYDNYNVYQLGAVYRGDPYVYQARIEDRIGDDEHKFHVENNIYRKLDGGFGVSVGQEYEKLNEQGVNSTEIKIRGGISYRDPANVDTILGKIDFLTDNQDAQKSSKWIANFHWDHKPDYTWEYQMHIGYKYVIDTYDQSEYKGSSVVFNGAVVNYFAPKWDATVQGVYALSPASHISSTGVGVAIGYNIMKNMWVSVGYQFMRNYDSNYNFDESYIKGVFIRFRIKFDEESFHLNDNTTGLLNSAGVR